MIRSRFGMLLLLIALGNWVSTSSPAWAQQDTPQETLVIVGGGGTPRSVIEKTIELAGGVAANIVVVPQASSNDQAGNKLVNFFESFGCQAVSSLSNDTQDSLRQLEKANLIWIGGGSQNRILKSLDAQTQQAIGDRFRRGCIVGGTSAGAAVMSKKMITGNADLESIRADTTELTTGLGLTSLIIDQHFHQRRRFNRLMAAVLDHPENLGLGIDERTAVILRGATLQVMGKSTAILIDASNASVGPVESEQHHSATGVQIHLLKSGQVFSLESNQNSGD